MKQKLALLLFALAGCSKTEPSPSPPRAAPRSEQSAASVTPLLQAELHRDPSAIDEAHLLALADADRVAATRSLSRIADPHSLGALLDALADENPDVTAWAAFGVGQLCHDHEPEAVQRLVLRAASLAAASSGGGGDRALSNIAFALGRCASDEAERTLRGWLRLRPPLRAAAILGVAQVARQRQRLDDATVAALLDAASQQPDSPALHPLESLPALGAAARERLLEVATRALSHPGEGRGYAVRALSKAGPDAAPPLGRVLESEQASAAERADAARSLAALGDAGQAALAAALPPLSRALIDGKAYLGAELGVLLTVLESLEPKSAAPEGLTELSQLPVEGEPAPVVRRKIMLRCRAASLLAGRSSQSPALLSCDPSPPAERREGALATLEVLSRGPITGARGARFTELAGAEDRVVREAALELLVSHDEAPRIPELLESALLAEPVGVRATAAKVIARYPARAQTTNDGQATPVASPGVVQALSKRLSELDAATREVELAAALLDAASALSMLGVKPAAERACGSSNPTLRKHAERAFTQLGEPRRCESVPSREPWTATPPDRARVELETDAGPLTITLWGDESPFAVGRFLELARGGFFDGMAVHRVVPGFVAQLGDPDGDGFGGAPLPPLRCQTSAEAFETGSVGVALSGRDTGRSQFFVTLRPAPHLAGEYSQIGKAEGAWERLVAGDRIVRVRVLEASAK